MRELPRTEAAAHHSIAERLAAVIHNLPPHGVTLHEIRDLIGRDGLMMLAAFLTIVFLVPVSIPGVSTVFGAGILLIGFSRLIGRDLWLPRKIGSRTVSAEKLRGALHRGLNTFRKLERISRPRRLDWATSSRLARLVNDFGIVVGAILLMAPFGFVPFSNTLPAIAILLLAIGILQSDGVSVIAGHVSIVLTMVYFAILIGGGGVAIKAAFDRFFG
jgi:hypothetical protein